MIPIKSTSVSTKRETPVRVDTSLFLRQEGREPYARLDAEEAGNWRWQAGQGQRASADARASDFDAATDRQPWLSRLMRVLRLAE